MRDARHGLPRSVLMAALSAIEQQGAAVVRSSAIIATAPIGPSRRRFANAAAILRAECEPPEMLRMLKRIERKFGRRSRGQRWGARVLDLDILLWSGGVFASRDLVVPHPAFRDRDFALAPASRIAPDWRDPLTGLTLRQLHQRLTRPRPLPR